MPIKLLLFLLPIILFCSTSNKPDVLEQIKEINSPQALLNTAKFRESDFYKDKNELEFAKAISKFDREKMNSILKNGLNINNLSCDSISFLCWAFIKFKKNSYKYLLENGADPNLILKGGKNMIALDSLQNDTFYLNTALKYSNKR